MDWGSGSDGFSHTSISGYPTTAGTYTFTVEANNRGSKTTHQFTITISAPPPIAITTEFMYDGLVDEMYYSYLSSDVYSNGYYMGCGTWSRTGELPPGLDLSSKCSAGQGWAYIEGTPTTAGRYTFTVEADYGLRGKATKQYTINIVPQVTPVPTITAQPTGNPSLAVGSVYTLSVTASVSGANGLNYQLSYQWYSNGSAIPNATSRTYTVPTTAEGTVNYSVQVKNHFLYNSQDYGEVPLESESATSNAVAIISRRKRRAVRTRTSVAYSTRTFPRPTRRQRHARKLRAVSRRQTGRRRVFRRGLDRNSRHAAQNRLRPHLLLADAAV
jgi:hypothetical protein